MNENEMNRTAALPGTNEDAAALGEAAPHSEFYQAPVLKPGKRPNAPVRRRTGTLTLGLALILVGLHLVRGKKEPLPPADEDYRDYGDQK